MKHFLPFLALLLFVSCSKLETEVEDNPLMFFWEEMDKRYVYFDEKQIDWDSVRNTLSAYNPGIEADLVSGFTNMIARLKDSHVCVMTDGYYISYPYGSHYNYRGIYLGRYAAIEPVENETYRIAQLRDSIVFIEVKTFENYFWDFEKTVKGYQYSGGIIMDIRNNSGGSLDCALELASNLISGKHTVLYKKNKNGAGHDDFTGFKPVVVSSRNRFPGVKLVLIIDEGTYSAANLFTSVMKNFTSAILVGNKTGGGGAGISGGILPNGWTYSISQIPCFDPAYHSLEPGIAPHHWVIFGAEEEKQQAETGIHNQMEFAYQLLKNEK